MFQPPPKPGRGRADDHEGRTIADFSRHYGLTFRDPALLKLALTHRSYLHVTGQRDSNERLEFLGDSILGLVTSEYLYRTHPTEHEGQLTKTKSLLVSKAILSRRALAMGLGRFVLMSHSEVESGGRQRLSILADAFESVVGAIYLDQGFEAARAFIERWLLRDTRSIVADKRHTNYKSHLQEYVQSTFRTHPVYRIRSEMGPDHSKQFMVEVIVGRRTLGEGKGRNKKEAEQAAARNALERVERGPVSDRELRDGGRRPSPEPGPRGPRAGRAERRPRVEAPVIEDEVEEENDAAAASSAPGFEERETISSRRRRRGRRGGRGRRRPAEDGVEAPPPAEEPSGEATRPVVVPVARAPLAAPRWIPPEPEEELRSPEVEPLPRRHEEDENEEVGRPEGPREDAHVDPYAWGGQDFRTSLQTVPPPPGAPAADAQAADAQASQPGPATSEIQEAVDEELDPGATSDHDESPEYPDPETPPPASPAAGRLPTYGRRPGRTRR